MRNGCELLATSENTPHRYTDSENRAGFSRVNYFILDATETYTETMIVEIRNTVTSVFAFQTKRE